MKFITGQNRQQVQIYSQSLDDTIDQNHEIRFIDLFVDGLRLSDYGFNMEFVDNGRPAYHPGDLLKLYIYGYLNRVRSSRLLEKETKRNLEVIWLMKSLSPDHNTISNFRKENPVAIKKVFRATVSLAQHFKLIGGKLIAGDSTKLRAQNSKKNNFNAKKIERHIAYIDSKLEAYSKMLSTEDGDSVLAKELQQKSRKHTTQRTKYKEMEEKLRTTGQVQISTSDPDSRQLITRNNITEVAYNVQTSVDAKHNIPIDFKVTNQNDSKAMGAMVRRAKTILKTDNFTALYDKGYHTGTEFAYANKHNVEVIVAAPEVASHAPDIAFDVERFHYNKQQDAYICPAGETLKTNGRWYFKKHGKTTNRIKHYKTSVCQSCRFFERCTKNKNGRLIERTEHADLIDENKSRLQMNQQLYRKRQTIVEHPFGILKRQWDFYYIMTKKNMKHASADVGLMFIAYNLRRIFNLTDKKLLKKFLKDRLKIIHRFFQQIKLKAIDLRSLVFTAIIFCPKIYNPKPL